MFNVVHKHTFTGSLFLLEISIPAIAEKARPGQYVDIHLNPDSSVITLPIVLANPKTGTITVVERGHDLPSERLMMLQEGDSVFQIRGPLGSAMAEDTPSRVVLAAEGLGVASLLWRARTYKDRGAYTICVIGFASRSQMFWDSEIAEVSDELYVATEDGTYGVSGKIIGPVRAVCETHKDIDRMVVIGQLSTMKRAVKIATDQGIHVRMSFDGVHQAGPTAAIFDEPDSAQSTFEFARAAELRASDVDFDKLLARERALRTKAQSADASPPS